MNFVKTHIVACGIVSSLGLGSAVPTTAFADPLRPAAAHGGTLEKTQHHQFEVVFTEHGLNVYPFTIDGKPLDASKLTGTATFYHPNSPDPWFNRPLQPAPATPGQASPALGVRVGLSKVPITGAKVTFQIKDLAESTEPDVSFTVPFTLAQAPPPAVRPAPAAITYARATRADQAAISAQRVCKVSGGSLGSMGTPIKVTRGERSVFLCCQSCLRAVTADPDRYFGKPTAPAAPKNE